MAMKWYTLKELSGVLGVSLPLLQKWCKAGRFPNAKRNGHWRVPACDVEALTPGLEKQNQANKGLTPTRVDEAKNEQAIEEAKLATVKAKHDRMVIEGIMTKPEELEAREQAVFERESNQNALLRELDKQKEEQTVESKRLDKEGQNLSRDKKNLVRDTKVLEGRKRKVIAGERTLETDRQAFERQKEQQEQAFKDERERVAVETKRCDEYTAETDRLRSELELRLQEAGLGTD